MQGKHPPRGQLVKAVGIELQTFAHTPRLQGSVVVAPLPRHIDFDLRSHSTRVGRGREWKGIIGQEVSAFMNTPYRGSLRPEVHSNFHFYFLPMIWRTAPSLIHLVGSPPAAAATTGHNPYRAITGPANLSNQLCFSELFNGSRSFVVPERERRGAAFDDGRRLQKGFYPPSENISCQRCAAAFSRRGEPMFFQF